MSTVIVNGLKDPARPAEIAYVPSQLAREDIGKLVPTTGFKNWEEKFAFSPVCVGIENGVKRFVRFQKYEVATFGEWRSYFLLTRECGSDTAYCTHEVDW